MEPIGNFIDRKYRYKFHNAFTAYRVKKIIMENYKQQVVKVVVMKEKIIIYCQNKPSSYLLNINREKLRQTINDQLKLDLKTVIFKTI